MSALDANSLLYLEHFLPLRQSPEVHTTSESEQRLDWEIQSAVDKAVRDFVSSWYCSSVSKGGDEFEWEVRDAMLEAATELKRRAKQVDRRALAQRVLELCGCHLQSFSQAKELQRTQQDEYDQTFSSSQKLWRLYSSSDLPHPALTGPANQLCYTRALVDVLMHVLISKSHLETRTGRYMVGELITCNVVLPLVARLSNPDWLNQTIVDVFTQSTDKEEPSPVSPQQTPPEDEEEFVGSFWDCNTPVTFNCPETSSMQTAWSVSTAPLHDSSETSFQSPWSSDENVQGTRSSSILFPEKITQSTAEPLRSPYRTSRLYRHTHYDLDSPSSDERKISSESLKQTVSDDENFCDCMSPSDCCGLVCLEEDTLGLLGKCFRQNVIISEPPSPESTVEECPVQPLTYTSNFNPRSLGLGLISFRKHGKSRGTGNYSELANHWDQHSQRAKKQQHSSLYSLHYKGEIL